MIEVKTSWTELDINELHNLNRHVATKGEKL
jgi:hypothetical protein